MMDIIIDGVKYDFIGTIKLDNIDYVLYTDNENLDISSYTYLDGKLKLNNIDDLTYQKVLKEYQHEEI